MNVIQLIEEVKSKGRKVYYYANNGNAGDSLINMGFYELAIEKKLDYGLLSLNKIDILKKGDIVFIAGGGALVPEWDATSKFILDLLNYDVELVILPQSIRGIDHVMGKLKQNTIIFCREKFSYQYCKNIRPDLKIFLDHDMAFYAQPEKILNEAVKLKDYNVKNYLRLAAYYFHAIKSKSTKHLHAFRCDKEANQQLDVKRIKYNDISAVARFGAGSYENSLYSANKFLKIINMYDEVSTDRLHVSVAAYLLGKKVNIYNNSYYKCEGVYEQSMKQSDRVKLIK